MVVSSPVPSAVFSSIANSVGCSLWQVVAASSLLREGASVPFVARYRGHVTGGLEPSQLRSIELAQRGAAEVSKRREAIEKSLRERDPPVLTAALLERLRAASTLRELEALYEPFKRKRDTLAMRAHEAGLGELAASLWRGGLPSDAALESGLRAARCAPSESEQHLIYALAELVSLDEGARNAADGAFARRGVVRAKALPKAEPADAAVFAHYAAYEMPLSRVRPHVWLALHRGSERGALKLNVVLEDGGNGAAAAALGSVERSISVLGALPPGSKRATVLRKVFS
ncbi:hypothetical protein T492DRAFT_364582 [Pavlovales sp. CCMP2436]|nr:hypothetical protein T492DRAFT_364582 [Pavlovales sp. CCMP2436]